MDTPEAPRQDEAAIHPRPVDFVMEQQSSKREALLGHVLRRALDKGEGTPRTVLDRVARGDSWETVNALVQEGLLQRGVDAQIFFPSLQAMLRNWEDFDASIAPLQSVIRLGITILEDDAQPDKTATFEEVVSALQEQFPKLADPLVQRRFGWALFGLEPFISVFNAVHPLESRSLSFRPSLLDGIKTLEDVLAAQDRHRLEEDEKKVLRTYADAFAQTERRHSTPIMLGEDVRQDVVLHSLISKDEAELTDTKRVIVTAKGLRRGQQVVTGFMADQKPSQPAEDPEPQSSHLEDLIEQLPGGRTELGRVFALMGLHPKIVDACSGLFEDGHFRQSILEATLAVLSELRKVSNSSLDGADLINAVVSPKKGIVWFNRGETESDQSEQEGLFFLLRGLVGVMRNPNAHEPRERGQAYALHCMALASLLLTHIDERIAPLPSQQA